MELRSGYKQTEIGVVPSEWSVEELGQHVLIASGESPSRFQFGDTGVPYFKVDQFNVGQKYLEQTPYFIQSSKTIPGGSVIFPKRGASIFLNRIRILKEDSYMDTNLMTLTPLKGINNEFLYYSLLHAGLWRVADTTSIPQINNKHIYPFLVSVPPLPEQRAIAEVLGDVDALIASFDCRIAKKRALKQGVMQQLLTGKTRLPGFSIRREVKTGYRHSEWGVIPEDWEIRELGDLCRSISDGTHNTPKYVKYGIPFYSVENVTADNFTDIKFISQEEHVRLIRRCKPERGDILLTRIGSLGETKHIDWDINASIYVSLALLKPSDEVDASYLYAYSKSKQFVRDIEKRSLLNASPKKINMVDICHVPIILPPRIEQRAIAEVLGNMDSEILALEARLDKTRDLKQGLMQELLTGKTRLL